MGQDLAAADPDSGHGHLLRAPQIRQSPVTTGSGALHPYGHGRRRLPGRLSRRRLESRRAAAIAEIGRSGLYAANRNRVESILKALNMLKLRRLVSDAGNMDVVADDANLN